MRAIIEEIDVREETDKPPDSYWVKLVKLVPAEVNALYMALISVVQGLEPDTFGNYGIISIIAGFIGTIIVIYEQMPKEKKKYLQPTLTGVSFLFWAFGLGYPFTTISWYSDLAARFILILYVFFSPYIYKYLHAFIKI